ncbi:MAG: TonB-dependent receptor [Candidatus Sericytochromatia bacterium]
MKKNLLLSLIIATSFQFKAFAEDGDKKLSDMTLEELLNTEIVYSASKKEQKSVESPMNTLVIGEEEIKQKGYSNLRDLLADLPGIETIDYHFSEVGTLVPVRGVSGNNKIIVLVNGMKINPPARENMMFRNDESIKYAKRVEVIYGPGSALYGSDAVSMIINIVNKNSEDYKNENKTVSASVKGGMNNTIEGSAGLGIPLGENKGISGYLQYFTSNGTDYPTNYPNLFKDYKDVFDKSKPSENFYNRWDKGLNGFFDIKIDNSNIQYYHRSSSRSTAQGMISAFPFSEKAIWSDSSTIFRAENTINLLKDLSANTSLTYNKYEIDPTSAYVWLLNDKYNYNDNKYGRGRGFEFEEKLNYDVLKDFNNLGGFSNKLSFIGGFNFGDYESVPKATIAGGYKANENLVSQGSDFTYYDTKEDRDNNKNPKIISPITALSYQNYAGYLQADWGIFNTLSANFGARIDKDSRFSNTPITPRASLIWNPINNLGIKLIYGQAFVFPPPYFTNAVFQNTLQINQPNSEIKPEEANSTELNLVYAFENFMFRASAFYNTQSNLFMLGDGAPAPSLVKEEIWVKDSDKPLKLTKNTNSGKSVMYGGDTYIKYRINNKNNIFLSLSYVDGKFDILGKTSGLDRISNFNTRLGATFSFVDNWYISPRISYRSNPNFTEEQKGANKDLLQNAYQLDLYTYYDWNDLRIFVNANNLTNNKYALYGGYGVVPAEVLSVSGGIEFKL